MKKIAVIGAGRVGLVTAACLAHLGNQVRCIERSPFYLQTLHAGRLPFFEPGLAELVAEAVNSRALTFSSSIEDGLADAGVIFLCVGTPQKSDGAVDLTDALHAAEEIGRTLTSDVCIVSKSTVPPGTNDRLLSIVQSAARVDVRVTMVSNPEFLREGSAVADFLQPDRIVIGARCAQDAAILKDVYAPLDAPVIVTDIQAAELIKSISNFYLALRVSFANEVADLCDALQVDVLNVLDAVGMDARIGRGYLQPGLGFGGPCLPKDLRGLADSAVRAGVDAPMMAATLRINDRRIEKAVAALSHALDGLQGRCVGVLGLSFKAGTDDLRGAPSLRFIEALLREGATIRAHDPMASDNFRRSALSTHVSCKAHAEEAVRGTDAVAVMTAWPQYKDLSLTVVRAAMRGDVLFDGANIFEPADVVRAGLLYCGVGRAGAGTAEATTIEVEHVPA